MSADRALPTTATMMTIMAITPVIIYPFRHTLVTIYTRPATAAAIYGRTTVARPKSIQAAAILAIYTKNVNGY